VCPRFVILHVGVGVVAVETLGVAYLELLMVLLDGLVVCTAGESVGMVVVMHLRAG
jgi:hypothetical protein